ncbi:MAG: hypothetical protein IAE93_01260 [Ignavibacteria bacterium]|nr:hypothetical protein [Ignavibacteria bacterium]
MLRSRLFEVFCSLSHKDFKRFDDLVYSPYFNKSERIKKLWLFLKNNGDSDDIFSKDKLAEVVFGNEKHSEANLRMVIAGFVKLVEEFQLQKEYEYNRMEKNIRLLEIFLKNQNRKSFMMLLKQTENELDKAKKKDRIFYYRKYYIENLKISANTGGDKKAAREYWKKVKVLG